jgi:hypothetical protein
VIGSTLNLHATGSIEGLLVGRNAINVSALQNVNITALAPGTVEVNAGGTVSGTLIAFGNLISVSGTSVDASLLSRNISTSGDVTSTQIGFAQGTAANATSQSLQTGELQNVARASGTTNLANETKEAIGTSLPHLTRTEGRVTVFLPQK